jgi:hypothetical protein
MKLSAAAAGRRHLHLLFVSNDFNLSLGSGVELVGGINPLLGVGYKRKYLISIFILIVLVKLHILQQFFHVYEEN